MKRIYAIVAEEGCEPVYFDSKTDADRFWCQHEEPIDFATLSPAAECTRLAESLRTMEDQRGSILVALFDLMAITSDDVLSSTIEGRHACEVIRKHHDHADEVLPQEYLDKLSKNPSAACNGK